MAATHMIKHRTVLTLLQDLRMSGFSPTYQAQFGYTPEDEAEDDSGPSTKLNLNHGVWEELGKPDKITVTVEPGDLLNDGEGYQGACMTYKASERSHRVGP